jgi:hypothetical protein
LKAEFSARQERMTDLPRIHRIDDVGLVEHILAVRGIVIGDEEKPAFLLR